MYFSKETLATNSRLGGHWNELWANRNMWNAQHDAMIAANRSNMTPEWLAVNAVGGFTRDFWAEIDRQVLHCVIRRLAWNRQRPDWCADCSFCWQNCKALQRYW